MGSKLWWGSTGIRTPNLLLESQECSHTEAVPASNLKLWTDAHLWCALPLGPLPPLPSLLPVEKQVTNEATFHILLLFHLSQFILTGRQREPQSDKLDEDEGE